MTGIEIFGAIFLAGALFSAVLGVSESHTKTEFCMMCVKNESARHADVDQVTDPDLGVVPGGDDNGGAD